jgi:hypothetical protein
MTRICAWCQTEMPSKGETVVTHGICDDCANRLLGDSPIALQRYLDDLPVPVLVVDSDGVASFANRTACDLLGKTLEEIDQHRGGEIFTCIHAKAPEGCGRTIHCSGCVVRKSVLSTATTGEPNVLVPATLKHGDPDNPSATALTITTVKRDEVVLLKVDWME